MEDNNKEVDDQLNILKESMAKNLKEDEEPIENEEDLDKELDNFEDDLEVEKESAKPAKAETKQESKTEASKQETKPETNSKSKNTKQSRKNKKKESNSSNNSSNVKALEIEVQKQKDIAQEYQDKYTRLMAEFENVRKRNEKESKRMYDIGAKEVLEKLLPVVDNFERAMVVIPEEDKDKAFEQGVDKIYKQLMVTLEEVGVKPMNAQGEEFNPDLHNAVMHIEDEEFGENVVAEELQKGYLYKESVLRHSMVKVAN